jgi:hypothetical protein
MTTYESLQWKRLLAKPHDHWVVLSDLGQKTRTAKSESYFKFTLSNTPQAGGYYLANASQLSLNFHFSSQRTNLIGPCHPNCHWRIYCARQDCRPGGTLVSGTLNPQREDGVDTLRKSPQGWTLNPSYSRTLSYQIYHIDTRGYWWYCGMFILRQPMAMPCLPTLTSMYLDRRLYTGRISV